MDKKYKDTNLLHLRSSSSIPLLHKEEPVERQESGNEVEKGRQEGRRGGDGSGLHHSSSGGRGSVTGGILGKER